MIGESLHCYIVTLLHCYIVTSLHRYIVTSLHRITSKRLGRKQEGNKENSFVLVTSFRASEQQLPTKGWHPIRSIPWSILAVHRGFQLQTLTRSAANSSPSGSNVYQRSGARVPRR